jgi:hypothetical protein
MRGCRRFLSFPRSTARVLGNEIPFASTLALRPVLTHSLLSHSPSSHQFSTSGTDSADTLSRTKNFAPGRPPTRFSSWSAAAPAPSLAPTLGTNFCPVYMHHVSQTVLAHLQQHYSGWLQENGLDSGLLLNSNGTFVLQYPVLTETSATSSPTSVDTGRIWYVRTL